MIRISILVFLIVYSQISFSKALVIGKVCGTKISSGSNPRASENPKKYSFPLNTYEASPFFICDLQYHSKTPQSERKWDLTIYKMITAEGSLHLENENKKSNYYRYVLSMQPVNISNNTLDGIEEMKTIKGNITFGKNEKTLTLEGYSQLVNGQLALRNIIKEDSFYKLMIDGSYAQITLIRLQDFPIWIEIE